MSNFDEHVMAHLNKALLSPGYTVVAASVDLCGGLICTVRSQRVEDLVQVARSLLSQAQDEMEDSDDTNPLLECVTDALACLPNSDSRR